MEDNVVPFVLRRRQVLPAALPPEPWLRFDNGRQVWVNDDSGLPVVTELATSRQGTVRTASQFGETINTRTREGVDQSEGFLGSDLGETVMTKTQEGIDTTESTALSDVPMVTGELRSSDFGETIFTATREGVDQSERTS